MNDTAQALTLKVQNTTYTVQKPFAVQSATLAAKILKLVAPIVSQPTVIGIIKDIKQGKNDVPMESIVQMVVGFMSELDVELFTDVVTELTTCCYHLEGPQRGTAVDFNTAFVDNLDEGIELAYRVAELCFSKYFKMGNDQRQG